MSAKYRRAPYRWTIWTLREAWEDGPFSRTPEGIIPARPLGYDSLISRAKLAWSVFTGKADALFWEPPHDR